MSTRNRWISACAALSCVIGSSLLLIFNHPVRSAILDPLVGLITAFRYALGYVPQDLEWLVSLLLLFIIAIVTYANRLPARCAPEREPFSPPFPSEGPIMKLTRTLQGATRSKFHRERALLEIRDLAAHTLAYHNGISIEDAKASLDMPGWTRDASVCDFLSLDKPRDGKHAKEGFHSQMDHALAHIEQIYQEV